MRIVILRGSASCTYTGAEGSLWRCHTSIELHHFLDSLRIFWSIQDFFFKCQDFFWALKKFLNLQQLFFEPWIFYNASRIFPGHRKNFSVAYQNFSGTSSIYLELIKFSKTFRNFFWNIQKFFSSLEKNFYSTPILLPIFENTLKSLRIFSKLWEYF